jgi:hypothetical protein
MDSTPTTTLLFQQSARKPVDLKWPRTTALATVDGVLQMHLTVKDRLPCLADTLKANSPKLVATHSPALHLVARTRMHP